MKLYTFSNALSFISKFSYPNSFKRKTYKRNTPKKSALLASTFLLALTSLFIPFNASAEAGVALCHDWDVREGDQAFYWYKTGDKLGGSFSKHGPYKGSFRIDAREGDAHKSLLLWTGYKSRNDNGFVPDVIDDISNTMYTPDSLFPNGVTIEPDWEYHVLNILRTNVEGGEWYGYFQGDNNLRVDTYLGFLNGTLTDKNYPSHTSDFRWDYVGTTELKVEEGNWLNVIAYPEGNGEFGNCGDYGGYSRDYWPPIEYPEINYPITISKNNDNALLICGTEDEKSTIVTIQANKEINGVVSPVKSELKIEMEDSHLFNISIINDSGSEQAQNPNNSYFTAETNDEGVLRLRVTPLRTKDDSIFLDQIEVDKAYQLKVTSMEQPSSIATTTIQYVPFKFAYVGDVGENGVDVNSVAGYAQELPIEVWACDANTNEKTIVKEYESKPSVGFDFIAPLNGEGTLNYEPVFENGQSASKLSFDNSGRFTVSMTDNSFNCSGYSYCPIDGGASLTGSFTVLARPYTFSICDTDGTALPSDEVPFMKSGETFNVQVKPLVWQAGDGIPTGSISRNVQDSGYCERTKITTNLFKEDSDVINITLSNDSTLIYPRGRTDEFELEGTTTISNSGIDPSSSSFQFTDILYGGAGKIKLMVSSTYLGKEVMTSHIELGRIFPYKLKIIDDASISFQGTTGPSGISGWSTYGFSYMDTYSKFNVDAIAVNKQGEELDIFDDFYDYEKPAISAIVIERGTNRDLSARLSGVERDLSDFSYGSMKNLINYVIFTKPYTSTPDGPYTNENTQFGLISDGGVSDLHFMPDDENKKILDPETGNYGEEFPFDLDFRYGKMVITGGSTRTGGAIDVTLKILYWDGSSYVVNTDDNYTPIGVDNDNTRFYVTKPDVTSNYKDTDEGELVDIEVSDDNDSFLASGVKVQLVENGILNATITASQPIPKVSSHRIYYRHDDNVNLSKHSAVYHLRDEQVTSDDWVQGINANDLLYFGRYRGNDRVLFRSSDEATN